MHGRYASFYVNKDIRVQNLKNKKDIRVSPMHCIIKTHRQKAWDDGVAPGEELEDSDVQLVPPLVP